MKQKHNEHCKEERKYYQTWFEEYKRLFEKYKKWSKEYNGRSEKCYCDEVEK